VDSDVMLRVVRLIRDLRKYYFDDCSYVGLCIL
jgi:hypothetical protein